MQELIAQIQSIARGMWRRRWIGVLVAWIAGIIAAGVLLRIPDRYEATARVYVDSKSVLKPLMRDLAVEPDIDQTIGMLARTLITRPNIERLMQKADLDSAAKTKDEREGMIERLTREIRLTASGRDNVYSFSYRDTSREQAKRVVDSLVNLFVESDMGAKVRDAESARNFIDTQIKSYEARLTEAENRLKDFKLRNLEVTETSGGKDYFARIAALGDEVGKLSLEYKAAEHSRDALRHELEGESASLLPQMTQAPVPTTPELDSRLDTQRKQLDELLRRYTDLHPDVVATRRTIERLEAQKAQEVEARQAAAAQHKSVAGPGAAVNPAMQQVKLALAEAEANMASLRVRLSDTQSKLTQLRAKANRVPQIEAELAQLNRDYDVVRRNYEALVARREKASMSEEVDSTRLALFRVIDPPRTAEAPLFPSRRSMAPIALAFALCAGLAAAFLAAQIVPTFDSASELRRVIRRPMLGSVSMLVTPETLGRARRQNVAFASLLAGLVVVYGGWVALMSKLVQL